MKGLFKMNGWRYKLYQFMQGRYGFDAFGKFLIIASMVLILVSNLIHFRLVHLAGLALLVYAYVRIVSRDINKRQQENQKYLQWHYKFTSRKKNGAGSGNQQNSKTGGMSNNVQYNFYRCRNCGQTVRVPKDKGTLKITCPNCGNTFVN